MKRKNLFVFLSRNKKERSGRNQEGIASVMFDTVFTVAHTFPMADFAEIKMEVLRHGAMVEVIKPKSLRDLIKTEAENILIAYQNPK